MESSYGSVLCLLMYDKKGEQGAVFIRKSKQNLNFSIITPNFDTIFGFRRTFYPKIPNVKAFNEAV